VIEPWLKSSARGGVSKFLNATTKPLKARARAVESGVLDRGIIGTQDSVLAKATAEGNRAGTAVQTAERAASVAMPGDVVDTASVLTALDRITAKTVTAIPRPIPGGKTETIKPGFEALNAMAAKYRAFVEQQGPKLTLEKAAEFKRDWQELANKAQAWTADTPTKIEGMVTKKIAQAVRQEILKPAPDLRAVWSEFGFWTNLTDVLKATTERTRPQMNWGRKMIALGAAGVGGGGAAAAGDTPEALAAASVVGAVTMAIQSPTFKLVSAQLKNKLADALASGSVLRVKSVVKEMAPALAGGSATR
jgi:hypothetical protein